MSEPFFSEEDRLIDLINRIEAAGNKIQVNDQVISIAPPSSVTDTPSPTFGSDYNLQKKYETTIIKEVGGVANMADAAYAYRGQGSVVIVTEVEDVLTYHSHDPIFLQSLLTSVLAKTTGGEETEEFLIKDLPIFLNKTGEYIPPRTVDVITVYTENYHGAPEDEFRENFVRAVVSICSQYDFVVNDDSLSIGTDIGEYIEKHPGFVRCLIRP